MTEGFDVVIVGSGAGGGALALTLAQAGCRVLVLERGPRIERADYGDDELAIRGGFFTPDPAVDPHMVVTRTTSQAHPTTLGWTACCVGGATVHMGGYLYRFHPDDLRLASRCGEHEEVADWPYTYEELEPYYGRAEWEVGVSGQAGSNPFEGARSRAYPLPPVRRHPASAVLEEACRQRGWHPFPTPRAVNSVPYQGRPACVYCRVCAGYGCPVGARGSSQEALLPRAEATGLCQVRCGSQVTEVIADGRGKVTGCRYFDISGREHWTPARVVCISCSAVESARLLLLSRSKRFPHGLGNGNGLVGRHLQFHAVTMGEGLFRVSSRAELGLEDPHPFLGTSVMDHYFLDERISGFGKGGLLRFGLADGSPVTRAQLLATAGGRLRYGEDLMRGLREFFLEMRAVMFEFSHDFLPNRHTYVTLDPEVRDPHGVPVARIHLDLPGHHRRVGRWMAERALGVLEELGAEQVAASVVGGTSSYLVHGTCRAGRDPRTSVLDPFCRVHDVPNLYVVDGSFMPTSGGAPPTLTILANSFRVADHILERARRGDLG
jgi:choline dehydrogenase-like flavoprotein